LSSNDPDPNEDSNGLSSNDPDPNEDGLSSNDPKEDGDSSSGPGPNRSNEEPNDSGFASDAGSASSVVDPKERHESSLESYAVSFADSYAEGSAGSKGARSAEVCG
jgi:hypothetical protein